MATHSRILAWEIPWTEEPGGLQSIGSQRVRDDLETRQQHKTGTGEALCWEICEDDGGVLGACGE